MDHEDYEEGFYENNYKTLQVLLQSMIRNVTNIIITEIWEVKPELSQKNHILLF
jgi:hypothetical protein